MNNMNLYHLKYFIDAAQEGGISHSARKNYVTQSAVSRAISSLEQDLGVELIVHAKNHFQLTEAGEAILEEVRAIFEAVSHLKDTARGSLKTLRGPLRFGCNQAIASKIIAPALREMELQYPDVKPEFKLGNTDQIQRMIDKYEIDFGLVVDDGKVESRYQTQKVLSDSLLVVKSPKFKKKPFDHLIISRIQRGSLGEKFFREYKKTHGKPPVPKIIVSSWQVIMDLAIARYGAALIPKFLCRDALAARKLEVVYTKISPVSFDLCTIVAKNRWLPKNAQALLENLRL